jgi:hypothetical protein
MHSIAQTAAELIKQDALTFRNTRQPTLPLHPASVRRAPPRTGTVLLHSTGTRLKQVESAE